MNNESHVWEFSTLMLTNTLAPSIDKLYKIFMINTIYLEKVDKIHE